jgi:hypothetical protein
MKEVSHAEEAVFIVFVIMTIACLYWIAKRNPGWKDHRTITSMMLITAMTVIAILTRNDILGNIAHTLYAAIIVYTLVNDDDKDVVLLAAFLAFMTAVVNLMFKRCTWAAIFKYTTDYKDQSHLICRDALITSGALLVKYFMMSR